MKRPSSLRRRIIGAYLLFALTICAFFGLVASIAIEGIEDMLVDEHLHSIAAWAVPRHAAGMPVDMPADVSFYHGAAIPSALLNLPPGVAKKTFENKTVHLLAGRDAAGPYVVLDRASEYKRMERVIYAMLSAGFLGFVALSLFLGSMIARRFVDPIARLAAAVSTKDAPAALPLQANEDELGVLARAFAAHSAELRQFLVRERFFTGDVSHELRTPLTIIIGAAELLIEQTAQQPALRAASERILRAARDAADCVAVLLLLARTPGTLDKPLNSLAAIAHEEVERCRPLLQGRPITLQYEEIEDFTIPARRELLACAIGNLIRNACQYTEVGEVLVRLDERRISVDDTGPGVPEAVRARLQHGLAHAPLAGSGLGLALVARICEHLGATLQAGNRPGGGSSFHITFE